MSVGERLKAVIDDEKLSSRAFGVKYGLSPRSVQQWVKDEKSMTVDALEKMATQKKDLNLNWLITGIGSRYNTPSTCGTKPESDLLVLTDPVEKYSTEYVISLLQEISELKSEILDLYREKTKATV